MLHSFSISLNGAQTVPAVTTTAAGTGFATFDTDTGELRYSITTTGLDFGTVVYNQANTPETADDVTAMHIHMGARGGTGSVAFNLISQDTNNFYSTVNPNGSTTLSGLWDRADTASTAIDSISTLFTDSTIGSDIELYVNIHTANNPGGEIRGQLVAANYIPTTVIEGTQGDDRLVSTAQDEAIMGGAGVDSVVFAGNRADASVGSGPELQAIVTTAAGGRDVLTDVELLVFDDTTVDLRAPLPFAIFGHDGVTQVGHELVMTAIVDQMTAPGSDRYQWLRDGVAIEGAADYRYTLTEADLGARITTDFTYTNVWGFDYTSTSEPSEPIRAAGVAPDVSVMLTGILYGGTHFGDREYLYAEVTGIGSASAQYEWLSGGEVVGYDWRYQQYNTDIGNQIEVRVTYDNGDGTTGSVTSASTPVVTDMRQPLPGTQVYVQGDQGNNVLDGYEDFDDYMQGYNGNDVLRGHGGDDTLFGGLGYDTLNGGDGNDSIEGSVDGGGNFDLTQDLRDVIYAGDGNDTVNGGYGNDELNGGAGDDIMNGGFGADTIIGNGGNDALTGAAYGDVIFGGAGIDFINGGFGSDRLNGGADADRFYHQGIADHGNDWIQDFSTAEGDVLEFGGTATIDQFQVNIANTAMAGSAEVSESFIIYIPTEQILWALVDGAEQSSFNIIINDQTFELMI